MTWTNSPLPGFPRPLKFTTPSMSGASALERPTPGASTRTLTRFPTFPRSRAALISAWTCIRRSAVDRGVSEAADPVELRHAQEREQLFELALRLSRETCDERAADRQF